MAETAQAFMGLTVGCARCHDHKFDPILQRDYYAMAGIFLSTSTKFGTLLRARRSDQSSDLVALPAGANEPTVQSNLTADQRAKLMKDLAAATADLDALEASRGRGRRGRAAAAATGAAVVTQVQLQQAIGLKAHLQAQLNMYDSTGKPMAFCMGVEDRPKPIARIGPMGEPDTRRGVLVKQVSGFETIADSPLFFRGEMSEPRDRVPRAMPGFLAWSGAAVIPANTSGRMQLANWIASPKNPMTARGDGESAMVVADGGWDCHDGR